jgi:hypothetical protein
VVTPAVKTAAAEHLLAPTAPERLAVQAGPAGLVLGRDSTGDFVRLRLFRPEPTRVTFVGGGWAARVLLFRCLAHGARIAVRAADPRPWLSLDATAGGVGDRVWPVPGDQPVAVPADDIRPVVHLYESGNGGYDAGPSRPQLGPWQTQITVLNQLGVGGAHPLAESDLVVMQRLSGPEAALAAGRLNLGPETASWLPALRDDMVVIVGGGTDRYAWLMATSVERHLFGPPVR